MSENTTASDDSTDDPQATMVADAQAADDRQYTGTRQRVIQNVRGDRLALIGLIIAVAMIGITLFSIIDQFLLNRRIISTVLHDPFTTQRDARLVGPNMQHPMGTDEQGRDVLARVIYGTRTSIIVGIAAVSFAAFIGVIIGTVSAYFGKVVDMIGMRAMDVLLAFPAILLAIALMAVFGRGTENVILAIGIVYIPTFARITRSEVLSEKSEEYVDAARVVGYPNRDIMADEILPNCLTPIIVQFTFSLALAIIAEAALSFLGLGVSPPTPTWGLMLSGARDYMTEAWWYSVFPGAAIMITVLGFNLLGDSLRDALDPQEQGESQGRL